MILWIILAVCVILLGWMWQTGKFQRFGTPVRHQCSTCPNKKFVDVGQ